MRIKKGFTLAETLIVLAIMGVIATVIVTSIGNSMPDRHKALFKKAYSVTERTVAELVNDEVLYPYDPEKLGFKNDEEVVIPGSVPETKTSGGVENKFCQLFSSKLNILGAIDYNAACEFETTDGIAWKLDKSGSFAAGMKTIEVDIDVKDETNERGKDVFQINIYYDGRVNVDGEKEIEFLKSQSIKKEIKEDDE